MEDQAEGGGKDRRGTTNVFHTAGSDRRNCIHYPMVACPCQLPGAEVFPDGPFATFEGRFADRGLLWLAELEKMVLRAGTGPAAPDGRPGAIVASCCVDSTSRCDAMRRERMSWAELSLPEPR